MKKQPASLDASIKQYEIGLDNLEKGFQKELFLAQLLLRDQIAALLEKDPPTPLTTHQLITLDQRLRKTDFPSRLTSDDWSAWRDTLQQGGNHWWWWLDKTHVDASKKSESLWILLAGLLTTITIGWLVEIIGRLWGSGPDWLSTIVATLSILLTSGALTKNGPELIQQFLTSFPRITPRHHGQSIFAMALIGLIGVLSIRFFALSPLALYYNNRGVENLRANALMQSRNDFQRAVHLNPDYAEAYYNLADAYIGIGDYSQAQEMYILALNANRGLDLAYNGLGYVYILQGQARRAIPVLYVGLSVAQDDDARSALWTNLGRAYLEVENFNEAEKSLLTAIQVNPGEASAYCYLGVIAERSEYPEVTIISYWENCLRYADSSSPRGQELAAMAQAHLRSPDEE